MKKPKIRLSVVIPFYNEADCLEATCLEVRQVLNDRFAGEWELIMVDDGSDDATPGLLDALARQFPELRAIHLIPHSGQSAGLEAGFVAARGELIATMDGDGQNDPHDLLPMIEEMEKRGVDMMCGIRANRADNTIRKLSSRIANRVRARLLKDDIRDVGCSIRVFRCRCLDRLRFFRNAHRFFPALVQMAGFRVAEMKVRHRPRFKGKSKYGGGVNSRLWVGLADLWGVYWLRRRVFHYTAEEGPPKDGNSQKVSSHGGRE
ncbi:MAG: glycosyltransferase family 2 protein [Deltaproteobacteria bacterium]